ncbi:uncharacterized protein H6S33_008093 [Morchella sextelata]|uniref:uncharacterized protein n=1 Tax=Morchella sextelata TaxID=1174677 RepID=UPI001D03ED0E|nr:uncharacterized protein H6S33_008093 [Morchella sextelata]KAH0603089.1 hypothetical protein H6S33_008093 [Morchella sextelata]
MSNSTNSGQNTADISHTEHMPEGTSIVNPSGSINTIQTASGDAIPSSEPGDQAHLRPRRVAPANSIGPMLVGSHLAPGAFGDLLTPLFDPQQASQQVNPATSTVPGDFRNLQRRLATLREVQAVARIFTISPLSYDGWAPETQRRAASGVLSELHESVQRWNHFDTAAMVGEIMRASSDIEALNSALLSMRMTGVAESVPTTTQINNAVSAAAFLDAIASMAMEIGVFEEAAYHAYDTVIRLGTVVRVIPANPLNIAQAVAAMGPVNVTTSAIPTAPSALATPSDPPIMALSAVQRAELDELHAAMVTVLDASVGHFHIVPPTPANSLSTFSAPQSPPPSEASSSSSDSYSSALSGSRPSTPVNSIVDTDAELMESLEGLPQMVCVLVLELVVEHNWWSEREGGSRTRAREGIWEQQEEVLNLARDSVRWAQEELLKEDGQDQWVGWQRDYYMKAI